MRTCNPFRPLWVSFHLLNHGKTSEGGGDKRKFFLPFLLYFYHENWLTLNATTRWESSSTFSRFIFKWNWVEHTRIARWKCTNRAKLMSSTCTYDNFLRHDPNDSIPPDESKCRGPQRNVLCQTAIATTQGLFTPYSVREKLMFYDYWKPSSRNTDVKNRFF